MIRQRISSIFHIHKYSTQRLQKPPISAVRFGRNSFKTHLHIDILNYFITERGSVHDNITSLFKIQTFCTIIPFIMRSHSLTFFTRRFQFTNDSTTQSYDPVQLNIQNNYFASKTSFHIHQVLVFHCLIQQRKFQKHSRGLGTRKLQLQPPPHQ